jgi:RimJ/RimL family protein N-acetyltransferase
VAILTLLAPGDEAELERFLAARADSSMFLLGNSRAAGLVDRGEPLQATYIAAREEGAIVAVAAHCWNGNLMLQGPVELIGDVARVAVERSGREVRGILGPHAQVVAVRAALGLADCATQLDSREDLMTLPLADLRLPPPLADGRWLCRNPLAEDEATRSRWGFDYETEALGMPATRERRPDKPFQPQPSAFVLVVDGQLAAGCRFTAELPDAVLIGGVYTPPPLRNRGYGRAVVAGALAAVRARGVTRGVLFTENPAARAAYAAIGFRVVGDWSIVLFNR